jgi:ubiquinone/menaquinone biosynthesis C-methylase UbiE
MMTDYHRASLAVWEEMAAGWDARHSYMEEVARPVAERLLAAAALKPGQTVLELAAGTGVVGFAAALAVEGLRLIVSDFSPRMVEAAARQAERLRLGNVECRVLDAQRLELGDASVDAVLCRWGYMLMPDPEAAFRETRRVLRPGGRLACAVVGAADENPWASLPGRILVQSGYMPPSDPGAPGLFALADKGRLRRLFTDHGFDDPQVGAVAATWVFEDEDDYWQFLTRVAGAIAMVLAQLGEDERAAVQAELAAQLAPFRRENGAIELGAVSLVASAS